MQNKTNDDLTAAVRADFDRLAAFEGDSWNHNNHYHAFLLRQLPARIGAVLDVGCGAGDFARRLAVRADRVLGLDFSPEMVRRARERSEDYPNITYEVADVREWTWPESGFDCIATIAAMHHLPLAEMLGRVGDALRPGGVFLLLDLYSAEGVGGKLYGVGGLPVSLILRLVKKGRLKDSPEARAAWDAHGPHDHYATLAQARAVCARVLPGADVRRHLLWRYSIVWRKPVRP